MIIYVHEREERLIRTLVQELKADCEVIERSWLVDPGTVIIVRGEFICGS